MWKANWWEKTWCWERLRAKGEGGDRGWDGWMASPTQWTWTWANSGRQWRSGKPGVLLSMGSQRVGRDSDWTTTGTSLYETNQDILNGTSLAVQWLRLCTAAPGYTSSVPAQGTKFLHNVAQPKKKKMKERMVRCSDTRRWKDLPVSPRLALTRAALMLTGCCGSREGQ